MGIGKKVVIGRSKIIKNHDGRPSMHAEHDAMVKFLKINKSHRPSKIDILVVRMTKCGVLGNSRPCKNCIKRLIAHSMKYNIQIKRIYYSTEDGTIEYENFQNMLNSEKTYVSTGNRI